LEKRNSLTSSPNVFSRPKSYSISSENLLAKKTVGGNVVEKTKPRKQSIDANAIEDSKKLMKDDNLLSPSRYYRKYSMPEFINNFSSFSNSKYIKSSSTSIKSSSSANKIEANVTKKSPENREATYNEGSNSRLYSFNIYLNSDIICYNRSYKKIYCKGKRKWS